MHDMPQPSETPNGPGNTWIMASNHTQQKPDG